MLWLHCVAAGFVSGRLVRAEEPFAEYDLAMYERPSLPEVGGNHVVFPRDLKALWLCALERPDGELQRLVVDTLAIAHRRGMEGLDDAKPQLIELLSTPNQRLDLLRAVVQTLVVLDARDQAETLAALSSRYGLSIAQIAEPALANWKSPLMQQAWLERVNDANASDTMMQIAIDGLGAIKTEAAAEPLTKIASNRWESAQLRMSAAKALGRIGSPGLVELAERLMEEPSSPAELGPILAVELLDQQDEPQAVQLLTALVANPSTTIQSRALQRLFQIDTDLVDRHASDLVSSGDANVRLWCARAMIAKEHVDRIEMLAGLLNDVNPSLRREVASGLVRLAQKPELLDPIIAAVTEVLAQDQWQGCEQACVVLARLDHKPSGRRMVELLGHRRGEVQVASAWGLTQLRVKELLPDMLEHAQSVYEGFRSRQLSVNMPGVELHVAHLFIAFGDQRYRPADALMRAYLPKNYTLGEETRTAAAWAMGMLYEDDLQDDLVTILLGRLNDASGMDPEIGSVRQMSAISLGRMKAESAIGDLRKYTAMEGTVTRACYWSIERLTGEVPPPLPGPLTVEIDDWFLAPLPANN